jgi:hypothetical protein
MSLRGVTAEEIAKAQGAGLDSVTFSLWLREKQKMMRLWLRAQR